MKLFINKSTILISSIYLLPVPVKKTSSQEKENIVYNKTWELLANQNETPN